MTSARSVPTVLVVAYESDDHLPGCLAEIGNPDAVVVIDNSSSDATRDLAAAHGVRYVATGANLGFAAAVNVGLDAAWDGHNDVLLLNPDARVSAADLAVLHQALHEPGPRRAAVGPRLVGFDGAAQRATWPIPSPGQVWSDALGLSRLWRGPSFVVGAVLLINGAALAEVGTLDERYFLYAEEADWQLRARRAGWTVAVVDAVVARHVGAASSTDAARRDQLFHASAELFARRWYGRVGWAVIRLGSLVAAARRSVIGSADARARNRRAVRLYLRGPASVPAPRERAA